MFLFLVLATLLVVTVVFGAAYLALPNPEGKTASAPGPAGPDGNGLYALSGTSSLLRPLAEKEVLVPNEQVYYAERQHWASIVQPLYETFVFLLVIIWVTEVQRSGLGDINELWTFVVVAGVVSLLVLFSGFGSPTARLAVDPFAAGGSSGVNPLVRYGIAGILLLLLLTTGFGTTGILAVFAAITRLTLSLGRWSFYERRYITNRRLIESSGFLGSRISSMPLSRVTDIVYGRTVPGEIFGYAQMRVETAGQDQALGVVRYISQPDHFYEVLVNFSAPGTPGA